jgi:hypothetical protein
MTRSIPRLVALSLVPLAVLAFASAAPAKDKKPKDMKAACEKEVREKIKVKHAGAHDIELTSSREWQATSTQTGIGGTGTLKAANNSPRHFEWTCTYDTTKNKIVDVNVEKPSKPAKDKK